MPGRPIIVSFYTPGKVYEEYAERMRTTACKRSGLRVVVAKLPDQGNWALNCAMKPTFMLKCMTKYDCPIIWIDIDGEVVRAPLMLTKCVEDFAIFAQPGPPTFRPIGRPERFSMPEGWPADLGPRWFKSGTVYVRNNPSGAALLSDWSRRMNENPMGYEQYILQESWASLQPRTLWLPVEYCCIKKLNRKVKKPVIAHDLASTQMRVVRS